MLRRIKVEPMSSLVHFGAPYVCLWWKEPCCPRSFVHELYADTCYLLILLRVGPLTSRGNIFTSVIPPRLYLYGRQLGSRSKCLGLRRDIAKQMETSLRITQSDLTYFKVHRFTCAGILAFPRAQKQNYPTHRHTLLSRLHPRAPTGRVPDPATRRSPAPPNASHKARPCPIRNPSRLILARLRYESTGGRLPGSGGDVLKPPPSAAVSGKKRALPTWAGGNNATATGNGAPPSAKKAYPSPYSARISTPSTSPAGIGSSGGSGSGLFMPSYKTAAPVATPSPQASSASRGTGTTPAPSSTASTSVFTTTPRSAARPGSKPRSPASAPHVPADSPQTTATARLFTPSGPGKTRGATSGVKDAGGGAAVVVDVSETTSEPWTAEVVLRVIKEAGPSGASFEVSLSHVCTYRFYRTFAVVRIVVCVYDCQGALQALYPLLV